MYIKDIVGRYDDIEAELAARRAMYDAMQQGKLKRRQAHMERQACLKPLRTDTTPPSKETLKWT